jgi:hypothetical protein
MTLHLQLQGLLRVVSFMIHSLGEGRTAAYEGYLFEAISHMFLSSLGIFKCRWLDDGEAFKLKLPSAKLELYKDIGEVWLKTEHNFKTHCKLIVENHEANDSFSSPYMFFQIAFTKKHTINYPRLKEILDAKERTDRLTNDAWNSVCKAIRVFLLMATSSSIAFSFLRRLVLDFNTL